MAEYNQFLILNCNVHNPEIVYINVNCLEANDEFLESGLIIPQYIHARVIYLEIVIPSEQKFRYGGFR